VAACSSASGDTSKKQTTGSASSSKSSNGSSGGSSSPSGNGSDASITITPAKTVAANPLTPIVVKATGGTLSSVVVTNPSGRHLSGTYGAGKTSWTTTEVLAYARAYKVAATAVDSKGKPVSQTTSVNTLKPAATIYPSVVPAPSVSNFGVEELERAAALAGAERVACNQVLYHLEERAIEHAVVPWCVARGIAVVGYSPFGSGRFPGPRSRGGRVLAEIAAAHGATPRQVALAFLVRAPGLFTIPKAARAAHVAENARAGSLALSAEDVRRIDAAFPRGPWRGLPIL